MRVLRLFSLLREGCRGSCNREGLQEQTNNRRAKERNPIPATVADKLSHGFRGIELGVEESRRAYLYIFHIRKMP